MKNEKIDIKKLEEDLKKTLTKASKLVESYNSNRILNSPDTPPLNSYKEDILNKIANRNQRGEPSTFSDRG